MVRFNDKPSIQTSDISNDDILPITDLSDSSSDKKITLGQLGDFIQNRGNLAQQDLSNTGMLTDVILKAPNGVFEIGENNDSIIVKSDLNILMPNGKNSDKKLQNIDLTVEEDIEQSVTILSNGEYYVFITDEQTIFFALTTDVFPSYFEPQNPTNNTYWYDINNNLWKNYNGTTWTTVNISELGFIDVENGEISQINPDQVAFIPNGQLVALRDLSNLSKDGENHFANKDLDNLTEIGLKKLAKEQLTKFSINNGKMTNGVEDVLYAPIGTLYKKRNVIESGTITWTDNTIASGFSSSNYLRLPSATPSTISSYDLILGLKYIVDSSIRYFFSNKVTSGSEYGLYFVNGYMQTIVNSQGGRNSISSTQFSQAGISANDKFIYRAVGNHQYIIKDNNYTLETLPPLSSWVDCGVISVPYLLANTTYNIGTIASYTYTGTVDLALCKLDVNNNNIWTSIINSTSSDYDYTEFITQSDTLYFNADNDNPITYTNGNGETFTKTALSPINVSDKADGTYNVMLDSSNQPYLHSGNIYYQKSEPTSLVEGDIWLNKNTQKTYKYVDDELVEFADVPCGKVTIASGIITSIEQPIFNELRYKYSSMPSNKYEDLILGASGTPYTAKADGWVMLSASLLANAWISFTLLKNYISTTSQHAGGNNIYIPVSKNDVITVNYGGTMSNLIFRFIYAESEV